MTLKEVKEQMRAVIRLQKEAAERGEDLSTEEAIEILESKKCSTER